MASIDKSNEKHRKTMILMAEEEKAQLEEGVAAKYRTTGEQVSHLMFRKSGYIKEHEKNRSNNTSMESAAIQNDSMDHFKMQDIQEYKKKEAKSFFTTPEEESEKEK